MPPKKKKEPKNAYYFFMKEYKEKMESKGVTFQGMREVADACSEKWPTLTTEEKAPYEEQARMAKKADKDDLANKFTSLGVSFAELERQEKERREKENAMVWEIRQTVQSLTVPDGLKKHCFYIIHMNYYCLRETTYYPCEVAIARFSLLNGVQETLHSFIEHSELPPGFAYEARKISTETHEIPVPDLDNRNKDFTEDWMCLLLRIETFLKDGQDDVPLPPLYTMNEVINPVVTGLEHLQRMCGAEDSEFRVYPLPRLFLELRQASARYVGDSGFQVLSVAERELGKDMFNFAPGIACSFHAPKERVYLCSLAIVYSWCFLMADHCCQDLDIKLNPGQHIPIGSRVPAVDRRNQFDNILPARKKPDSPKPAPRVLTKDLKPRDSSPPPKVRTPETVPLALLSCQGTKEAPFLSIGSGGASSLTFKTPDYVADFSSLGGATSLPLDNLPNFGSSSDFPSLGGGRGGVFGNLPVAVAGRGRGRSSTGIGRGQKLAAALKDMSLKD